MRNHEDIKRNDDDRLKQNSRNGIKITDAYVVSRNGLCEMLSEFKSDWDGHFG